MSVTHIAGPVIEIGRRKIQRCSVCGEKLCDNLPHLQGRVHAVSTSGDPGFLSWEAGRLVRVDGVSQYMLNHVDGDPLPSDSCISLMEET